MVVSVRYRSVFLSRLSVELLRELHTLLCERSRKLLISIGWLLVLRTSQLSARIGLQRTNVFQACPSVFWLVMLGVGGRGHRISLLR